MSISVVIPVFTNECEIHSLSENINFFTRYPDVQVVMLIHENSKIPNSVNALRTNHDKIRISKDDGIYDALNKATQLCDGKWIICMGIDDSVIAEGFTAAKANLTDSGMSYYCNVLMSGRCYDGEFDIDKLIRKNICHQSVFYSKQLLLNNPYDVRYPILADWELNVRLWDDNIFKHLDYQIASFALGGVSNTKIDWRFEVGRPLIVWRKTASVRNTALAVLKSIKDVLVKFF